MSELVILCVLRHKIVRDLTDHQTDNAEVGRPLAKQRLKAP
jgi:hypothetical protein